MSVFLDEPNKRVILSARKCGLMTLSFSVTAVYKNKSENKGWYHGNPDPHYVHGNVGQREIPFDSATWADYDVTIIIRDPYERYMSGARTVWALQGDVGDFNTWYDAEYEKHGIDLFNGHTANWLEQLDGIEYNTLEVVDTTKLSEWQSRNGFVVEHQHKSDTHDINIIKDYIHKHYPQEIQKYLQLEEIRYRKWLTLDS